MSDLGMGWPDPLLVDEFLAFSRHRCQHCAFEDEPHPAICSRRRLMLQDIRLADGAALDRLIEFARRVRLMAHDSAAVRRLCDEILLRCPGTGTSPSGD